MFLDLFVGDKVILNKLGHFQQLLNNMVYHGSHQFCKFLIDALK